MKLQLYILLFLIFQSCSSQEQFIENNDICHFSDIIFEITKEEFKFNKKEYDSILSIKGVIIKKNVRLKIEIQNNLVGKTDKKTNLTKWIYYHPNGNIKSIAFFPRKSSNTEIGKETQFDKQGNVIQTIDHEKGYKICYAEAIEIVKQKLKNKLSKYDSVEYVLKRVDLNEFPNEKPMWSVGIVPKPDDKIGETTYYKIDGVTGKYMGKFTVRMVHN